MKNNTFYESNADDLAYFNFHYASQNIVPAHFHNNTEILFVNKGLMKVIINGKEAILGEKDIVVSNGFDVHYYLGDSDCEVYVLVFGDVYNYDKKHSFENFLLKRDGTEDIFNFLEYFYAHSSDASFELRVGFVTFLHGLLEKYFPDKILNTERVQGNFSKILSFVQENSDRDIKIEEVAQTFGYSKNYFSVLFNKITNMSFRDYLNRIRLEKMQELLKNDDQISVCAAALACGFNSLNTYYRAKKKFE